MKRILGTIFAGAIGAILGMALSAYAIVTYAPDLIEAEVNEFVRERFPASKMPDLGSLDLTKPVIQELFVVDDKGRVRFAILQVDDEVHLTFLGKDETVEQARLDIASGNYNTQVMK